MFGREDNPNNLPAIADFVIQTNNGVHFKFVNTSYYEPHEFEWDLGDGNKSTKENLIYSYEKDGTYTVTLKVRNKFGIGTERKQTINVIGKSERFFKDNNEQFLFLQDVIKNQSYGSGGGVCVPNFHSEDDMIDYIYYNNDSCIETIEWTGTQIGSKFINDFGINANVFILNCQKLTSVKLEYVTEMSDSYGYISNPLLIEILTPLLASVGEVNYIDSNSSLITIDQPLLASVGEDNYIGSNNSLTTIDQSLLASVGGNNYIGYNNSLTTIDQPLLASVGGNNYIGSNTSLTTIDQPLLASVGGNNYISSNNSLTTIDQPLLASVGGNNYIDYNTSLTTIDQSLLASVGRNNYIGYNNSLTTIDQPLLASIGGYNSISNNNSLTTIDQPLLASVGKDNYIDSNSSLTTIDQPLLASVGGDNYIRDNQVLTTIIVAPTLTFNNLNNNNRIYSYYSNNALNQTTVDAICDAILAGSTLIPINGAYLDFHGGTNAVPSGTRLSDLATAGWTVTTN